MKNAEVDTLFNHHDVVADHQRHPARVVAGELWEFDHLQPFVMPVTVNLNSNDVELDVVVLFSNHCYTRKAEEGESLEDAMVVMDGKVKRILDRERYELSKKYMPTLAKELSNRTIRIASDVKQNFVTFELQGNDACDSRHYAMFFEVKRDRVRKRRLLLRVQSAYIIERPSARLLKAEKMRLHIILKQALR